MLNALRPLLLLAALAVATPVLAQEAPVAPAALHRFGRSSELTARRREFRDDGRGDSGRARETRPPPAPERGGGRPARD